MKSAKPKLLFHVCCAPCSGLLSQELRKKFDVAVFYDNSNIHPRQEFLKRASEADDFFRQEGVDFILADWNHDDWNNLAKGLENEPERGKRCQLCYRYRLSNTARYAAENGFEYFCTSLSISPWKDSRAIRSIGMDLSSRYGIKFLADDFQADDGYKKSRSFAKKRGFYFQKYCGCEYSVKSGII